VHPVPGSESCPASQTAVASAGVNAKPKASRPNGILAMTPEALATALAGVELEERAIST